MDIRTWLNTLGYPDVDPSWVRDLGHGFYAMAKPLLFHWTVVTGAFDDPVGYIDRWCFADKDLALKALAQFPEPYDPAFEPDYWHRHPKSGRRREAADPAHETIEY